VKITDKSCLVETELPGLTRADVVLTITLLPGLRAIFKRQIGAESIV